MTPTERARILPAIGGALIFVVVLMALTAALRPAPGVRRADVAAGCRLLSRNISFGEPYGAKRHATLAPGYTAWQCSDGRVYIFKGERV